MKEFLKKIFKFLLFVIAIIIVLNIFSHKEPATIAKQDQKASSAADKKPSASQTTAASDYSNPKVGEAVAGVTLFDGWKDPRVLDIATINIGSGWTDSLSVSPDGKNLYFAYSKLDFSKFYYSNAAVQEYSGASRPGMIGDKFKIFTANPVSGEVSYHPGNLSDKNVQATSQALNEAGDMLITALWEYQGKGGSDPELALSKKINGTWTVPVSLPFNTPCRDDNPFIVGTQSDYVLYFESDRVDEAGTKCGGKRRIFQTIYTEGKFLPPALTPGLSTVKDGEDTQPSVSPNGKEMYWTSIRNSTWGIYAGDRSLKTGEITNVRSLALLNLTPPFLGKMVLIGEANVAEFGDKYLMYFMCAVADAEKDGKPTSAPLKVCVMRKDK